MKNIFKLFLFSFFVFSCSSSDSENNVLNRLIEGKWQLTHGLYFDTENPENGNEHFVENGYTYNFFENGSFNSTEFQQYTGNNYVQGNYRISNDSILTLTYQASGLADRVLNKRITLMGEIVLETTNDLTGQECIEGCGERFQKITDTSDN